LKLDATETALTVRNSKTAPLLVRMCALKVRIENGGTDVAAGTKYTLRWQGMETCDYEDRKQMQSYRVMWLQGLRS
jgi:hypothetical protein